MNEIRYGTADLKRFCVRVERMETKECWRWTGAVDREGYGRFTVGGAPILAHRMAFAVATSDAAPAYASGAASAYTIADTVSLSALEGQPTAEAAREDPAGDLPGIRVPQPETFSASLPEVVAQRCGNRRCCNPDHLVARTRAEHAQLPRTRTRVARGERHGQAKLKSADIPVIRARAQAGERTSAIAADLGVDPRRIRAVIRGETWRDT